MQQHIGNSIGGSPDECDWALFDHAFLWSDVDWLDGKLRVERGIVRQQVGEVKTIYSGRLMAVDAEMLEVLKAWKPGNMPRNKPFCSIDRASSFERLLSKSGGCPAPG